MEPISEGSLGYNNVLDNKPAVLRKQGKPITQTPNKPVGRLVDDIDYLDIPAFLRRHKQT